MWLFGVVFVWLCPVLLGGGFAGALGFDCYVGLCFLIGLFGGWVFVVVTRCWCSVWYLWFGGFDLVGWHNTYFGFRIALDFGFWVWCRFWICLGA